MRSLRRAQALGGCCSPAGAVEADEALVRRRLVQPVLLLGGLLPGTLALPPLVFSPRPRDPCRTQVPVCYTLPNVFYLNANFDFSLSSSRKFFTPE